MNGRDLYWSGAPKILGDCACCKKITDILKSKKKKKKECQKLPFNICKMHYSKKDALDKERQIKF